MEENNIVHLEATFGIINFNSFKKQWNPKCIDQLRRVHKHFVEKRHVLVNRKKKQTFITAQGRIRQQE